MARFDSYFDPDASLLKPVLYTWNDLSTWSSGTTWDDWLGNGVSVDSQPTISFTTDIIDFGRVADINPKCEVSAIGTVNIKVHSATSIDSSSLLPGDPTINAGTNQSLTGITARYFQFTIEVTALADSTAAIQCALESVQTDLDPTVQTEHVRGESHSHSGTPSERIVPLTNTYSMLTGLQGTAEYDGTGEDSAGGTGTGETQLDPSLQYMVQGDSDGADYVDDSYVLAGGSDQADASEIPVVVVRSLASLTQPKYAVFTTNGTNRDAFVYLTVSGLPGLRSDAKGNIVEV